MDPQKKIMNIVYITKKGKLMDTWLDFIYMTKQKEITKLMIKIHTIKILFVMWYCMHLWVEDTPFVRIQLYKANQSQKTYSTLSSTNNRPLEDHVDLQSNVSCIHFILRTITTLNRDILQLPLRVTEYLMFHKELET